MVVKMRVLARRLSELRAYILMACLLATEVARWTPLLVLDCTGTEASDLNQITTARTLFTPIKTN